MVPVRALVLHCHSRRPIFYSNSVGVQRKTLDPGFRRDDSFEDGRTINVIFRQGRAGYAERCMKNSLPLQGA